MSYCSKDCDPNNYLKEYLKFNVESLIRMKVEYCRFLDELCAVLIRMNVWSQVLSDLPGRCHRNIPSTYKRKLYLLEQEDDTAIEGEIDSNFSCSYDEDELALQEVRFMSDPFVSVILCYINEISMSQWSQWLCIPERFIAAQHEKYLLPLQRMQSSLNQALDSDLSWNRNCISHCTRE